MVELLVQGLPAVAPDLELHHVNLRLSSSGEAIGKWHLGKFFALRRALRHARQVIANHGCDILYYVPAPGKRIALWRDLLVLSALRPFVPKLVLHWHASGLGAWLETQAMGWERRAAQRWLGRADLSIVLGDALRADTEMLHPRQTLVVPNGIPDPFAEHTPPPRRAPPTDHDAIRLLFLGAGSEAKGLFRAIDALPHLPTTATLTFAGDFATPADRDRFAHAQLEFGERLTHAGFVTGETKRDLLATHDVLVFPTRYENEAFPLVILEALAADLPIVTTRWRAIPEMLPHATVHWIDAKAPASDLAEALQRTMQNPPATGQLRAHFLAHYTTARHLSQMADALRKVSR